MNGLLTGLAPERTALLDEYMRTTVGKVIDPYGPNAPSAVAFAQDYLQFLVGHKLPHVEGDAYQWAGKQAGRVLANIPPDATTGQITNTHPWATFTPSPFVNTRRHRETLWPIRGDLIVFDKNPQQGNPWGTLGAYLDHEQDDDTLLFTVYTQGFGPPGVITIDTDYLRPLGWWRVTDHRLRLRQKVTA